MRGLRRALSGEGIKVHCKIHSLQGKSVLAACDSVLLGKTLKKGELDFRVSEAFYKGSAVTEKELLSLMEEHSNINLLGEKVVAAALKKGLISERDIIKIAGVPHAQIYRV